MAQEKTPDAVKNLPINQEYYEKNTKKGFQDLQNLHQNYIHQNNKYAVLMLSSPECIKCTQMTPIFNELAQELNKTHNFIKFNITEDNYEESTLLLALYNPKSAPTFIFVKDGIVQGQEIGYITKEIFRKKIETAFPQ
jgi:thioredoxin-related protein